MGALVDEYEYLMQKSFDGGEASGFIKAQAELIEYREAVADKCRTILGND